MSCDRQAEAHFRMATEVMAPLIYAGVNGLLDKVEVNQITAWEKSL